MHPSRPWVAAGDEKGYVSVHDDLSRARRAMGYCPQFDGLQPNMTGREHLQFYAQIRGVPTRDIDGVVNRLVRKMSLEKYADRAAGTYSGGNKRKLSVALLGLLPGLIFIVGTSL